jgi:hypothetical protein
MKQTSYRLAVACGLVGLVMLLLVISLDGGHAVRADGPYGTQPTVVPAHGLTPAPTPSDGRLVAVLHLQVISDATFAVERVTLPQCQLLKSYAPHVLGHSGEWTVALLTRDQGTIRFGTPDPRRVEVFDTQSVDHPYRTVLLTDATWDLVVPLYDGDRDLHVSGITISDQAGRQLLAVALDHGTCTQQAAVPPALPTATARPAPPQLSVSPTGATDVSCGSLPITYPSVTVKNVGGPTLTWQASATNAAVHVQPTSGSLGAGQAQTVTVSQTSGGGGTDVRVTSNGGSATISFQCTVG